MLKLCRKETFEVVKAMGKSFEDKLISLELRSRLFADERHWVFVLRASTYSEIQLTGTMVDIETLSWRIPISYVFVRGILGP